MLVNVHLACCFNWWSMDSIVSKNLGHICVVQMINKSLVWGERLVKLLNSGNINIAVVTPILGKTKLICFLLTLFYISEIHYEDYLPKDLWLEMKPRRFTRNHKHGSHFEIRYVQVVKKSAYHLLYGFLETCWCQ